MWGGARLWRKIVTKWGGESGVKGGGSLRTIMPSVGGHTCITAGERSEPAGGMTGE